MSTLTDMLADDAVCIDRCIPPGRQLAVLISQAAQWAGLSTDPAVLMKNAACYDKCIPAGQRMGVLVSLAEQLLGGGSGSGGGDYVPTNPEVAQFCLYLGQLAGVGAVTVCDQTGRCMDAMVTSLKNTQYSGGGSLWSQFDAIYPFVGGNSLLMASVNLVNPAAYQITWHGNVSVSFNGVTGDGATAYGDTGFNPSTAGGAHYQLFSGSMGVQTGLNQALLGALIGTSDGSPLSVNASVETGITMGINATQVRSGPALANYKGLYAGTVTGASSRTVYDPSGSVTDGSAPLSTGLPNANFFMLHTVGAFTQTYSAQLLEIAFIGGGFNAADMTNVQNIFSTFNTCLGRL